MVAQPDTVPRRLKPGPSRTGDSDTSQASAIPQMSAGGNARITRLEDRMEKLTQHCTAPLEEQSGRITGQTYKNREAAAIHFFRSVPSRLNGMRRTASQASGEFRQLLGWRDSPKSRKNAYHWWWQNEDRILRKAGLLVETNVIVEDLGVGMRQEDEMVAQPDIVPRRLTPGTPRTRDSGTPQASAIPQMSAGGNELLEEEDPHSTMNVSGIAEVLAQMGIHETPSRAFRTILRNNTKQN